MQRGEARERAKGEGEGSLESVCVGVGGSM